MLAVEYPHGAMVGEAAEGYGAKMTNRKSPSNAERIHAALSQRPMSRIELQKVLGLGQISVELALRKLREKHTVYTVQTTRTDIVYELA